MVILVIIVAAFGAGFLASGWFSDQPAAQPLTASGPGYVCPMHDHVTDHAPGDCPICGMSLVPVAKSQDSSTVEVSPAMINSLGIRSATVDRGTLYRRVQAYGYIQKVESGDSRSLTSPFAGKVVRSAALAPGEKIEAGTELLVIESPQWLSLQQAWLDARDANDTDAMQQARLPLFQAGLSPEKIQSLMQAETASAEYVIHAPEQALLAKPLPATGTEISAGADVAYTQTGFPVIGFAEVFEGQWRWLEQGQRATMQVRSIPGVEYVGQVLDIEDLVASRARTIKVRIGFGEQPGIVLRSGMHADVSLYADPRENVLRVPRDAVIRGRGEPHVIVALGDGRFQPRVVRVGLFNDDWAEIEQGLEVGEQVVVSGQFLLDSESNLSAEFNRMDIHQH